MGKEIVYCSVCGDRVPYSDLEKGKAVMLLRKYFCRTCAVTVVKESAEPNHDPTATPKQLKIRTQRIPLADNPKPAFLPYLVATVIAGAALALLAYVLFLKKS